MFMVLDIAKPSEIKNIIDDMVEFCKIFNQDNLVNILK